MWLDDTIAPSYRHGMAGAIDRVASGLRTVTAWRLPCRHPCHCGPEAAGDDDDDDDDAGLGGALDQKKSGPRHPDATAGLCAARGRGRPADAQHRRGLRKQGRSVRRRRSKPHVAPHLGLPRRSKTCEARHRHSRRTAGLLWTHVWVLGPGAGGGPCLLGLRQGATYAIT